jgi:hypothetical protein
VSEGSEYPASVAGQKTVTSSTSEVVSEITLNPEVMQIPPAPEESPYRKLATEVPDTPTAI